MQITKIYSLPGKLLLFHNGCLCSLLKHINGFCVGFLWDDETKNTEIHLLPGKSRLFHITFLCGLSKQHNGFCVGFLEYL
jgi:hypothetical protein